MKKVVVLGLASLFILTGCGSNKVTCKGTAKENGQKVDMKVVGTVKNDKISKVSAEMKFSDKDTAKSMCSLMELANSFAKDDEKIDFECDGKTLKIKDYSKFDSDSDSVIGKSKADFIKAMEKEDLTCK